MSMKVRLLVCSLAVATVAPTGLAATRAADGHQKHPALPVCPVMGDDPIDLSIRAATPDGPVFFCCADCIDPYKEHPAKYAAQVAEQRARLAGLPKVQTTCPVSGKPVDKKISVGQGAHKVGFCCKECVAKFQSNPGIYRAALANSYTYQTKCPVMGGPIDSKAFMELADGRKIYFCCQGCDKKLVRDPAKYLPKLEAQGVHLVANDLLRGTAGHGGHDHDKHRR